MVEKRQPWMRFYTADWRGDAGLRAAGKDAWRIEGEAAGG